MKKTLLLQIIGYVFAMALGTLLHFLYELTGSFAVTPFSAVNESTWEHCKILFFPMFAYAIFERRYYKQCSSFWQIKVLGTLTGVLLIPVLFYTVKGAFGVSPEWFNILIFFLAGAVGYTVEGALLSKNYNGRLGTAFLILWIILAIVFVLFTYYPPKLPIFLDPITHSYGLAV